MYRSTLYSNPGNLTLDDHQKACFVEVLLFEQCVISVQYGEYFYLCAMHVVHF